MIKKQLEIESDNLHLHGVLATPDISIKKGVIFYHGGGHADAERYTAVQKYFANEGIASLAFSFRGCGKSEGNMMESTLNDRLVDAESALQVFKKITGLSENEIYLWGSSMGGHIACRLIPKHITIKGLILQSAAAYGLDAETQPFGPVFTKVINRINSWENSNAFTDLSVYPNPTLIIYGADDTVIPEGVKKCFKESAVQPQFHEIIGFGHPMLKPTTTIEKRAWKEMVKLAVNFILEKWSYGY